VTPRQRVIVGWSLLIGSTVGEIVTTTLWLLDVISTRALVGITLVLSWLALQFEASTFLQVANNRHEDVDE
jgi:ABC-type transport system involved in cytochrome c biogenesis permease subunit